MKGYTTAEMKRFNYLISETNAAYHEAAQKLGLSDSTVQVLYTICNNGEGCQIGDICRLSGISKQTINSALRKLEADGAIRLEMAGSKNKNVALTEAGKKLAQRTALQVIKAENEIFADWAGEDVEKYLELTERFLTALKEKAKGVLSK